MDHIVLAYDGSPAAESALDWVADRAIRRDSRIDVVLVANSLVPAGGGGSDALLARGEERLRSRVPGTVVDGVVLDGGVSRRLSQAAEHADLLVLGVDRDHPVRAALRGWTPQRLTTSARVPTCVVPTGWTASTRPVTVGLAADESSDAALDFAAAEAVLDDCDLRIVHAWSMPAFIEEAALATDPYEAKREHRNLAHNAADRVRSVHPDLEVSIELPHDNAISALAAASRHSSLVVLGSHGRGVLGGGFFGSVVLDLVGNSAVPVCVVPAKAGR